jgi:hypothetical protein
MNKFGDGLVTLLALLLGLGSLNLAFHGLMDGTISGGAGAEFVFAKKPVKFILIELFWVGLAGVFLLAAWRGTWGKKSDPDDLDEDPEPMDSQPLKRGINTRANDAIAVTVPAPLSAPAPNEKSPNVPPRELELTTSRGYAILVFIMFTPFVVSSGYTTFALSFVLGKAFGIILFVPVALAYVFTMRQCIVNYFWSGPVLRLDRFGITNYRRGGHLIPWTDVDALRIEAHQSSTYLMLRFRDASDVLKHFGTSRMLRSVMQRLFYKGFEGRVKLTSLSFKRSEVLQVAQAFLRYSRR